MASKRLGTEVISSKTAARARSFGSWRSNYYVRGITSFQSLSTRSNLLGKDMSNSGPETFYYIYPTTTPQTTTDGGGLPRTSP
jgi:hypothetical protein